MTRPEGRGPAQGLWKLDNEGTLRSQRISERPTTMGHLYVLEFTDGLIKVGHANTPGKRVIRSAREVAGRCGVTLTRRWVSEAHEDSEDNAKKLTHWACCCGRPVFGFRELFTEVPFDGAVQAAQHLMEDQELALLMSAPVSIRDLFPGTFGYRLRHAVLSGISP